MKKYLISLLLFPLLLLTGCNEKQFLAEKPLDFMGADNSYVTEADYTAAITELYYLVRQEFYSDYDYSLNLLDVSDVVIVADPLKSNMMSSYNPTSGRPKAHWDRLYKLISQANVVVSRLDESELNEGQRQLFGARALFFRSLAYRTLAYLYGGVPIVTEEVSAPRKDFTRASQAEVLALAIEDAEYAAKYLPEINAVKDGEISKPAAYTLLAELYLAAGRNEDAVNAATQVIGNPNLALMKNRFGSRAGEEGDVYWDLFRRNNQNRASGNTEGIWVIQFETNVPGGGNDTSHSFWNPGSFWLERFCAPQVNQFHIITPDGTPLTPFNWPIGDYTGGRGIGTFYSTPHMYREIWASDFDNDIRNSQYNFPRKFKYHKPEVFGEYAELFGEYFDVDNPNLPEGFTMETGYAGGVTPSDQLPNRFMCGYQTKCTTPFNHPAEQYMIPSIYMLSGTGGKTYTDQYMFRLPEAYLLRAEAYLKMNQKDKAAADINVVRERANASPCTEDEVDLDYILDERMREFGIEEKRLLTLSRTGTVYDRISRYNPYYAAENSEDGKGIQAHYALMPIPQSVIEANTDAVLEQNPGY